MRVALTIDTELPLPGTSDPTDAILDEFAGAGVAATFFAVGEWAAAHPETTRRITREGHLLGNHTMRHRPLTLMTSRGVRRELEECGDTLARVAGTDGRPWMRCPHGWGTRSTRIARVASECGYVAFGWDLDTGDWRRRGRDARVAERVEAAFSAAERPTCVVLMHSWPMDAVGNVRTVIDAARNHGHELVRLDDIAGD